MMSRTGRSAASKRGRRAARMPSGTAIATEIATETETSAIVSIDSSQRSIRKQKPSATTASTADAPAEQHPGEARDEEDDDLGGREEQRGLDAAEHRLDDRR